MKRVWTVLHQKVPRTDAQQRWEQAYQLLLQCASPSSSITQCYQTVHLVDLSARLALIETSCGDT